MEKPRQPTLIESLVPVVCMIAFLVPTIVVYKEHIHIPLLLATAVATIMAARIGMSWDDIEQGMAEEIAKTIPVILMLMLIGILIGLWILSGIVPTIIYYGLLFLSPQYVLVSIFLVCCVVSVSLGTSWTTMGTIGVALMGVGEAIGIPLPWLAGAVISGSYFGDKMSPISDTVALTAGVTSVSIPKHIRHMCITTGPTVLLAIILYTLMGVFGQQSNANIFRASEVMAAVQTHFTIHPLLLLLPLFVVFVILLKIQPTRALFVGAIVGAVTAMLVQGASMKTLIAVAYQGFTPPKSLTAVTGTLFQRGGLTSVYDVIVLIIIALAFGGVMNSSGMLHVLTHRVLAWTNSSRGLVVTTAVTSFGTNALLPDQYLAIIVPSQMYKDAFAQRRLALKNLARCLGDCGVITSPLIPWNTCGLFALATLGVSSVAFFPFAFLNWINPLVCILFGLMGISMPMLSNSEDQKEMVKPPVKGQAVESLLEQMGDPGGRT